MPVFTAIATYIVEAAVTAAYAAGVTISAAAASYAISVVAIGLSVTTSRLINGTGSRGGAGTQDQGVRIQLPPNTEIKIPIVYGQAFQQGIITDARIGNQNRTMTYVLTLSEQTASGTFSVDRIYWNDQELVFKADGYTVDSSIAADGSTNNNLNGLVRVWVYAGGSSSANQIKGPTPAVNAYDIFADGTTSAYAMSDLVFAVIQLDYNGEKGVTGLPAITFELFNSLKNPGDVWVDYITNTRYGAAFDISQINTATAIGSTTTSLKSISDEIPTLQYEPWPETTSTTYTATNQVRYEINGVINTGDTAKTNLEKINFASASWTTYDHRTGQWKIVPNRALTVGELSECRSYSDDNITSDIQITATPLEDLYNRVEVSFANRGTRDQTDYYTTATDASELNTLEPVNRMQIQTALCNNAIHAGRIANIELKQSRIDLVISFQTDYTGLQTEAGDVIKVSSSVYGFDNKLFRVTRVRETEGADGVLAAEITALEYSNTIYSDVFLLGYPDRAVSDIPAANSTTGLPAPGKPFISYSTTTEAVPYFILQTELANSGYPVDTVSFYYSNTSTSSFMLLKDLAPVGSQFYPGNTATYIVNTIPYGTWYFRTQTNRQGNHSDVSVVSDAFLWEPAPGTGGGGYYPPGGGGDPGQVDVLP